MEKLDKYIYIKNKRTFSVHVFMHIIHLHFGPSQVLIYSLNIGNDVSDFIFDGRLLHIFGPKALGTKSAGIYTLNYDVILPYF